MKRRLGHWFKFVLVLDFVVFLALSFLVKTKNDFSLDLSISRYIQNISLPYFSTLMHILTNSGWGIFVVAITTGLILILLLFQKRLAAVFLFLNISIEGIVFYFVSKLINRTRPDPSLIRVDFKINIGGYPSGHVMMYVVVYGFLIYLTAIYIKNINLKTFLICLFATLIFLIGVARIYSGQHWPSDVLGAYLLGGFMLGLSIKLYDKVRNRVHKVFPKIFPKNSEIK